MKHPNTVLLVRGALATAALALGFAQLSQKFDPIMSAAAGKQPATLAGSIRISQMTDDVSPPDDPIRACHLIEDVSPPDDPIRACHLIERPADRLA